MPADLHRGPLPERPGRRTFLLAGAAALAACAAQKPMGVAESVEVPVPRWPVGRKWVYRRTDLYTKLAAGVLTREIVGRADAGYHVVTRDEAGRVFDDARYSGPGRLLSGTLSQDGPVRGSFEPPLLIYDFTMVSGKTWSQSFSRTDADGFRTAASVSTKVEGWETVTAGGREYPSIIIQRRYNLGPKDAFHGNSLRDELEWYAPELGGAARLRISESYYETLNSLGLPRPGARYLYELESFTAG